MAKLFNRAKMTTSTTGSGTVTLGSASVGYQSFADAGVSNGDVVQYVIEEGGNFEIGTGTYSSTGTSLTRSPTESSNSGAAISLGGAATVSITAVADDLNRLQHAGSTKVEPTSTGATVTGNLAVTGTVDGRDVATDGTKLDGIESGATADQTAAEIRTLVESATDSNVFTDADHTKLNGIESGATADQTASEILTAIKTVDGSGSGLDADTLDGSHASAFLTGNQTITLSGDASGSGTTSISVSLAADSVGASEIAANAVGASELNVTGNGTSSQFLRSDGDGTFTWATPTDTNTTYSAGSGLSLSGTTFSHTDTSSQSSVNNSGGTVIQDITLDTYGHVTGLTSYNLDGEFYQEGGTSYSGTYPLLARISERNAYSNTGITFTGSTNTLSVTGNITVGGTVDGRDVASDGTKLDGIESSATADQTITAGSGLTGGGTGDVTISHADTSSQASVNNSGRTYIQDITLDTYGHITGITSATETVTNTNQLTTFQVEDGDGTEVTISHGKEWKFVEGGGVDINWTDTSTGSDGDPYDLTFSHADTSSQASVNNSGATVIQDVTLDTYGHVTGLASKTMTLADLGFTGDTNANYITNNNQLTNGAGYTTFTANQNLNTNGEPNFLNLTIASNIYHQYDTDTGIQFSTDQVVLRAAGSNEVTVTSYGVRLGDTGNAYVIPVSGDYGSFEIDGGAHGSWEGYSIGGRAVFMHDNSSSTGIYNDVDNEWLINFTHNGATDFYANGSNEARLETDGDFHADGNVIAYSTTISDPRLKENIKPVANGLEKVMKLNGYTFDYKADGVASAGVISTEVKDVLPSAIKKSKLSLKLGDDNQTEYDIVQYDQLTALFIEAIKDLKSEIDELKAKLGDK